MKTILENFLDALDICYTKRFTRNLFEEHPHKNNMYGQGGRIKMRSPPKVLTGNFRPSQLSSFLS